MCEESQMSSSIFGLLKADFSSVLSAQKVLVSLQLPHTLEGFRGRCILDPQIENLLFL